MSENQQRLEDLYGRIREFMQSESEGYDAEVDTTVDILKEVLDVIASERGMTGLQGSAVGNRFLMFTHGFEGPFRILLASEFLYPQYDKTMEYVVESLRRASLPWLRNEAQTLLDRYKNHPEVVSPEVERRWRDIIQETDYLAEAESVSNED